MYELRQILQSLIGSKVTINGAYGGIAVTAHPHADHTLLSVGEDAFEVGAGGFSEFHSIAHVVLVKP